MNALNVHDGSVIWSRDVAKETETTVPEWAVSGSPLVVGDLVIVAASGTLAAYDLADGKERWTKPAEGESYCSPHLLTIDGVEQVVMNNDAGAFGVLAEDGKELWQYEWSGPFIIQPAMTEDEGILIGGAQMRGMQRLAIKRNGETWSAEKTWSTTRLKPDFSDLAVHKGHAYGFDGSILTCVDVTNGKRVWKGGRYGHGQLLLLADQDRVLLLTETGELALAAATPDKHDELAKSPAIEGKTWNHPVLVGDLLLVRNDQEMAAFRLPSNEN
ncbi:MAG: PQQ-binding-like beta-propeller repeat protein [Planctomycetota bacterium]|nr:PQQ-binding-like beta-propeller repeat protein [Planctomycetota bacterium]